MTTPTSPAWPRSVPLLWAEFASLFALAPFGAIFVLDEVSPILVLLGLVVVSLWLLARTPDFRMADLLQGPVLGEWKLILGFTALSGAVLFGLAVLLIPGRFLEVFRYDPDLWLMIMALYPLFSALPQEIIFRTLFFRRYGRLFPSRESALAANVGVFVLAHLFFLEPLTLILTAAGGLVFAWAYLRHGSTLLATVLHAIAGQLLFTSGLGVYFYHGAIGTV